jgi:hypothetical protein
MVNMETMWRSTVLAALLLATTAPARGQTVPAEELAAQAQRLLTVEPVLQVLYTRASGITESWDNLVLRGQPLVIGLDLINPTVMHASGAYVAALAEERGRIAAKLGHEPTGPIAVPPGSGPETMPMILPATGNYWVDDVRIELVRLLDKPESESPATSSGELNGASGEFIEVGADEFRGLLAAATAKTPLPRRVELHSAQAVVSLPPERTSSLPPGTYLIRFTYDTTPLLSDRNPTLVWRGSTTITSKPFQVRDAANDRERIAVLYRCMSFDDEWKDYEGALASARAIAAIENDYGIYRIHLFIGGYEERLGHYDAAARAWQVYFDAVPEDLEVSRNLHARIASFPPQPK